MKTHLLPANARVAGVAVTVRAAVRAAAERMNLLQACRSEVPHGQ